MLPSLTKQSLDPSRGDARLLGDHRDDQGKRFLDLRQAINLLTEDEMKDGLLQGPRVMVEFLRAVRSSPGDLATYHLTWAKSSGVNMFSMACYDHRIICNVIRAALEIDQLNVGNTEALELLARRLVQIETAVSRCPSSPDFSGLEDPIGSGGEAIQQCSTFGSLVNSKRRPTLQNNPGFTKKNFVVEVQPVTLPIIQIHRQVLLRRREEVVVVDEANLKPKPAPVVVLALWLSKCKPRVRAPADSGV